MNTYLIVNIRMPEVLLLNPRISDPDTYKFLFLLFWKHLQHRTRSMGGDSGQSRAAHGQRAGGRRSLLTQRRGGERPGAPPSAAPRSSLTSRSRARAQPVARPPAAAAAATSTGAAPRPWPR